MAKSSKDIQLSELKDMIAQLNTTIRTLNDTIARQQAENGDPKAEPAWFRQKMFGSSSEHRTYDIAGQLRLFDAPSEEEKPIELIIHVLNVRTLRNHSLLKIMANLH